MVAISSFEETQTMAFSVGRSREPGCTFCDGVSIKARFIGTVAAYTEAFDPVLAS